MMIAPVSMVAPSPPDVLLGVVGVHLAWICFLVFFNFCFWRSENSGTSDGYIAKTKVLMINVRVLEPLLVLQKPV